ncbi:PREDICTED: lysine-specific demethylase 8-like [Nicrophorus vespilloides]|uniref:Lysine-specific demethylase 8-like n=1 Tax=Nicrophorus vespilloides TaxID=110193 RepID=A0ABM1MTT2_NICVS|nr:PREDICTED: lysine-specific demethylase 8-like [Nicrophorus vespilloides]
MDIHQTLRSYVNDKQEIYDVLKDFHCHLEELYKECCDSVFGAPSKPCDDSSIYKIDLIVTHLHEHLNVGKWSEVPENKRKAFSAASFIKCSLLLQQSKENVKQALECIDKGFLLGIPLKENSNLLTQCASYLNDDLEKSNKKELTESEEVPCKRVKYENDFWNIDANTISVIKVPTLEEFYKNYFLKEIPVIMQGCMCHWPACSKWLNLKYLLKIAGGRTVPIEIGSSYSDTNFSQKLMTLKEFVDEYYLKTSKDIGYLAQHDLLNQVPELKEDICIPEYCCTSRNFDDDNLFEPEINAWFGPEGTVSSLHQDPKDNFLCQVFGTKQVILFAPTDNNFLYPHEETFLSNTAQVDPLKPDLDQFPDFAKATMYKCLLNPQEMLYIPPKWWHHVTAIEKSFSVNFWWQ